MKTKTSAAKRPKQEPAFFSTNVERARRFYLDLSPSAREALTVVCGGLEHCTASYTVRRDTFPFYSIEYVIRGRGALNLRGHSYDLLPGQVFSYGPGVPHTISSDSSEPLVKFFIDFTGAGARRLLDSCRLAPSCISRVGPAHSLQPLFDEIINAGLQARRGSAVLCRKLLECLALRIEAARVPLAGPETLAFTTYQQARQKMEQDFLRFQTLEQIARECQIDCAYLCRLFRRYDQQTPYQYLLRLKMNHAAARLQEPGTLVKQVAEETGFADPFHFSRVFTARFGLSPSAFRGIRHVPLALE
jgi:AraC-like DNA-binding protein